MQNYCLTSEMYRLLKFDIQKILDSATPQKELYVDKSLHNADDYFARSFTNPEDYFYFRFRNIFISVVWSKRAKVYHVLCENFPPRVLKNSTDTRSVYLAKNLYGDFDKLYDAVYAFYQSVDDCLKTYLNIPHQWQQLELY